MKVRTPDILLGARAKIRDRVAVGLPGARSSHGMMLPARLEALVIARAHGLAAPVGLRDFTGALARFRPPDATEAAWRDQLAAVARDLRARGVLDPAFRVVDPVTVTTALGRAAPRDWRALADRVLPGLGLGLPAATAHRLRGRDDWAAAISARVLALWAPGAKPPSLAALCDALVWHRLGLAGTPKRCPPELRASFIQRELGCGPGPADRLVRLHAARAVEAPRPELRALRDALVRRWLAGRELGAFADDVRAIAAAARDGLFGDRKLFIAAAWEALRAQPAYAQLTLDAFKHRLLAAQRAGDLALARADLVAAMDPALVAASETSTDGATFHFIVREAP